MTEPYTPFRPDFEFVGHPMPPTVPEGLRIELSRARLLEGKEAQLDEWMQMLTDRYEECLTTLPSDTEHEAYAKRIKERGWEELQPLFMLAPAHITEVLASWGTTGTEPEPR